MKQFIKLMTGLFVFRYDEFELGNAPHDPHNVPFLYLSNSKRRSPSQAGRETTTIMAPFEHAKVGRRRRTYLAARNDARFVSFCYLCSVSFTHPVSFTVFSVSLFSVSLSASFHFIFNLFLSLFLFLIRRCLSISYTAIAVACLRHDKKEIEGNQKQKEARDSSLTPSLANSLSL